MFNSNNKKHFCTHLARVPAIPLTILPSLHFKRLLNKALQMFLLIGVIGSSGFAAAQDGPQPTLESVELKIADKTLKTELAITREQRYMGLSFRKSMAENEAMLFVFPTEEKLFFTMRNTLIPLTIAYISDELIIEEILQMPVGPDQVFPSKLPARFALEVNQGWFERNGVRIGSKISIGQ